ncbi:MAG: dTMP kinase [Acidobacteriota bacterium]
MLMGIQLEKCRRNPWAILARVPFITFEGVEGCGKSTQMELLAGHLRSIGRACRITREPGGTAIGERIRAILMDTAHAELDPMAEWLLIEAARRQHVVDVIRPAFREDALLLCDRFSDSTEAYQTAGRGLDAATVSALDERVREGTVPDLTLLYDLDVAEGLARARRRDGGVDGRFEAADEAMHERVRSRYLDIARREPERVAVISVRGGAETVFADTWRIVSRRFGL